MTARDLLTDATACRQTWERRITRWCCRTPTQKPQWLRSQALPLGQLASGEIFRHAKEQLQGLQCIQGGHSRGATKQLALHCRMLYLEKNSHLLEKHHLLLCSREIYIAERLECLRRTLQHGPLHDCSLTAGVWPSQQRCLWAA